MIALALLFLTAGLAAGADDLIATEIVRVLQASKDMINEPKLTPLVNQLLKEGPTWDKPRMTREFDVLWQAAKSETSENLQGAFYKTATAVAAMNPKEGRAFISQRLNDILDAIEAGPRMSQVALMEHLSVMKIPDVPEETMQRMTRLATSIERLPGGMLFECAVTANPASPAVEAVVTETMKKPPAENTMDIYGGYLNGVKNQKQNPSVRAMLQRLTTVENEQVRQFAEKLLNEPIREKQP
jgi:hypothetical protein